MSVTSCKPITGLPPVYQQWFDSLFIQNNKGQMVGINYDALYVPDLPKAQLLELADLVDRAHDIILERGWSGPATPGSGLEATGHCMESAVLAALGHVGTTPFSTLGGHLDQDERVKLFSLGLRADWNDEPSRTEDEVFDRMREVAKKLREEAGAL